MTSHEIKLFKWSLKLLKLIGVKEKYKYTMRKTGEIHRQPNQM